MKYTLLLFFSFTLLFLLNSNTVQAQSEGAEQAEQPVKQKVARKKKLKGKDSADLSADEAKTSQDQKSPELAAYEKKMAKTRKEKEKRNAITRKKAEKKANKRLKKSKTKTRNKKKKYVKTHGG